MLEGDIITFNGIIGQITQEIEDNYYVMFFDSNKTADHILINKQLSVKPASKDEIVIFNEIRNSYISNFIVDAKALSNQTVRELLAANYDWRLLRNERKKFFNQPEDDLTTHHLEANKILTIFNEYCTQLDDILPYTGVGIPPITSIIGLTYDAL
jgi:hypothetical protein